MMAPRYRGITADQIPEVRTGDASVRVIAGTLNGVQGPVRDLFVDVEYLDVSLPPGTKFEHKTDEAWTAFAYTFKGATGFSGSRPVEAYNLVELGPGNTMTTEAGPEGARFLLVSGMPLGETIAWRGSIVMNTQVELDQAYRELKEGSFIKTGGS
jgi:redox-sensitive bicupin YhaK (pirin superfamily)